MARVVSLHNITRRYRDVLAVDDVSLEVEEGRIFGLVGPDGAGKSTLVHVAGGILGVDSGSAVVLGVDVLRDPEAVRSQVGLLPQGLGLILAGELSVEENLDYAAEVNGVSKSERTRLKKELLEAARLDRFKDRLARNLSGGMRQKLALCCTLVHSPKVLFLDEPTTGVDPISRQDIWMLINRMMRRLGTSVLLTTSYLDEAERCSEIALMHKGRILETGDVDSITGRVDGEMVVARFKDQPRALEVLAEEEGIRLVYPLGDKVRVLVERGSRAGELLSRAAARNGLDLLGSAPGSPTLQDAFLLGVSGGVSFKTHQNIHRLFDGGDGRGMAAQGGPVIEVKGLTRRFGDFTAVDDISFSVEQGEIFGFLGPNGAGKTTTIKMLCGLFPPSDGTGSIMGLDLKDRQFAIKENIGYMSQKFSLYRDLTVGENIRLYAGIYGVSGPQLRERQKVILEVAGLSGKDRVMTEDLPMGFKQRLALGCAIIHKPRVVFLDEPTSGVDPVARQIFWDMIYYLSRREGITILVTTHYMNEAEHCDRLSLMHRGRILALGSADSLKQDVVGQIGGLLEIATPTPFQALDALKGDFELSTVMGSKVHVYSRDPVRGEEQARRLLEQQGLAAQEVARREISFEDVFVYFCSRADEQARGGG